MLKTLLVSTSLSLALLAMPIGPVATAQAANLPPANGFDFEIDLGGGDEDDGGIEVGFGDDEGDDEERRGRRIRRHPKTLGYQERLSPPPTGLGSFAEAFLLRVKQWMEWPVPPGLRPRGMPERPDHRQQRRQRRCLFRRCRRHQHCRHYGQ